VLALSIDVAIDRFAELSIDRFGELSI